MTLSVRDRIREQVEALSAVDVHTHLGAVGPRQAVSLADLMSYHWLQTELIRAGAPVTSAAAKAHPAAYAEKAAPYFEAIRNTGNHFCFMSILRGLYGFPHATLTPANWREADEAVRAHAQDPAWPSQVLDRARVARLAIRYTEGAEDRTGRCWLYAHGEPFWAPASAAGIRAWGGDPAAGAAAVREAIGSALARMARQHRVQTLHVWVRDSWAYRPWDAAAVDAALARVAQSSGRVDEATEDLLMSWGADAVSEAAAEHGLTIQLFHGMWRYGDGRDVPLVASYWNPDFLRGLVTLARRHPGARYDVFLATRIPGHEAASVCRILPNVSVSGAWWHGFTPATLRSFFRDRLDMLPSTAWNAFYSDAYRVEWIYGKAALARRCLALELAGRIEDGLLDEECAVHIARRLLHDNALRIYGLKD